MENKYMSVGMGELFRGLPVSGVGMENKYMCLWGWVNCLEAYLLLVFAWRTSTCV